jgi:hypothetical protein
MTCEEVEEAWADTQGELYEVSLALKDSEALNKRLLAKQKGGPSMSWSFNAIGLPENICKALDENSTKLGGQSRIEFDSAKPLLAAILRENFAKEASASGEIKSSTRTPVVIFEASGSGGVVMKGSDKGEQLYRNLQLSMRPIHAQLV